MGPMMMQTAETQTVMDNPANDEPHVVSSYRDNQHFEESIQDAASRIMRWSGLRFQWYVLTIGGVVLIVFTLLKLFEILIGHEPQTFLNGMGLIVAWVVALGWTWLYSLEARGLSQRIIKKRLCLQCGHSLLDSATDDYGSGVCSNCCHVFNLGEYLPPTGGIEALRTIRQGLEEARRSQAAPPIPLTRPVPAIRDLSPSTPSPGLSLYKDEYHFNRVMARAAARQLVFKPFALSLRFTLYGILLPSLVFTLMVLNFFPIGWPFTTMMILGCLFFLYLLGMKYLAQLTVMQCRIVKFRLCLSCGHSLEDAQLDEKGIGACPKCGQRFHALLYKAPEMGERNSAWQDIWRELFLGYESENYSEHQSPTVTQYFAEQVKLEDPPGSGRHVRLITCASCGYILEGSPTDENGRGICSECGSDFIRNTG